jgi:hypothetical protein
LYEEGSHRIHKEFSVERVIRSLRELKVFSKEFQTFNKDIKLAILTRPQMVIDLSKEEIEDEV